jgi:hypothetical protein
MGQERTPEDMREQERTKIREKVVDRLAKNAKHQNPRTINRRMQDVE